MPARPGCRYRGTVDAATLVVICAIACGGWLLLASAIPIGRRRARRRAAADRESVTIGEWIVPAGAAGGARTEELDATETRGLVRRGLRSDEREVRVAAVTALCGLAREHEWALDGLVEALASELETPERVATELDHLAPRPGRRLVPLLSHPSEVVRFYVVRLLGRYPDLARRHVVQTHRRCFTARSGRCARDPSGGRLERNAAACARAPLDPHPFVRAQASRRRRRSADLGAASFVAPLLADESWWVREAAREALVGLGPRSRRSCRRSWTRRIRMLRKGAALVLQDVGAIDALAGQRREPASSSGSWRPAAFGSVGCGRRARTQEVRLASTAGASLERVS